MDIDLLSKMVKELILDNDKVVLPGLGSFVAEIVPSTFSDKGYTINPPYRRLYFRAKPDQGDALIDFYASTNNVDRSLAERIIKDFMVDLKSTLHVKKNVVFPGLGRLRATKENNLFFVADEDLDIYPAGFGLEPVSLKTHQETQEEVSDAVAQLKSMIVEVPAEAPVEPPVELSSEEPADVAEEQIETVAVEDTSQPVVSEAEEAEVTEVKEPDIADTVKDIAPRAKKKAGKKILKAILVLLLIAVILLGTYVLIGYFAPHLLDRLLYTPEELEILNFRQ